MFVDKCASSAYLLSISNVITMAGLLYVYSFSKYHCIQKIAVIQNKSIYLHKV